MGILKAGRISRRKVKKMKEKVEAVMQKIRLALQRDGGDVQLIEVTPDGIVKVKLVGACANCPMSQMTLKSGIEATLKREIPEVKKVEQV